MARHPPNSWPAIRPTHGPPSAQLMARHPLGLTLTSEQNASIVAFPGSLTDEADPVYSERTTPATSGPDTPAPNPS